MTSPHSASQAQGPPLRGVLTATSAAAYLSVSLFTFAALRRKYPALLGPMWISPSRDPRAARWSIRQLDEFIAHAAAEAQQ